MPASIRITLLLCGLKLRLLFNSLKNWASFGKAFGIGISIVISAILITSGASDLIDSLRLVPYAELMLDWILGAIAFYAIFIVFTGDLITGHSLNTGQMSSDFVYLRTLPVPPLSLICIKLFERVITDYLGLLILLSAFLGITCRDGVSIESLLLSLALFLEISLLTGLLINLCMIFLTRFFKTTSINNFFSLLGYVSAFLSIVPYLILTNFPVDSMNLVISNLDILNETVFRFFLPIRWLAVSLISKGFCDEFFFFSAFWAVCMMIGTAIFHVTISLNWFSFSHSNSKKTLVPGRRLLRGLFHKEVLMLRSDFNLLINAIMMPVTLIILEIYFLKGVFSFSTPDSVLNIIYGSIIYFSMFGPVNCIGYEGKAISLLETLPMSPADLLFRKSVFWLVIAEAIFVPAAAITVYTMNYTFATVLAASLSTAMFTAACVWVAVSVSAIFPNFDSKILQQRSTLPGKLAALGLMLLIVPVKGFSMLNLYSCVVFLIMGVLTLIKGRAAVFFRLDKEALCSASQKHLDVMLLFMAFAGAEASMNQFFRGTVPGIDTGMWSWLIPALLILPAGIFMIMIHRSERRNKPADAPEASQASPGIWLHCLFSGILAGAAGLFLNRFRPEAALVFKDDVLQIIGLNQTLGVPEDALRYLLFFGAILLALTLSYLISRNFLNQHAAPAWRLAGVTILILVTPGALMPAALLTALAMLSLQRGSPDHRPAMLLATTIAASQAWYFIFL